MTWTENLTPVDIDPRRRDDPVRLCVALRRDRGELVDLRRTPEARVVLGGLFDRTGRLLETLEVWVQDPGFAETPAGRRAGLDNHALDARWERTLRALAEIDPGVIVTGWEESPPPAIAWDGTALTDASGRPLVLCDRDEVLEAAGLPAYRGSARRFLWNGVDGAPADAGDAALGVARLGVRRAPACGWRAYIRAVSTGDAGELPGGIRGGAGADRQFFLDSRRTVGDRLLEVLYLKVLAIHGAVLAVREATRVLDRPNLSLEPGSISIDLPTASLSLPLLWAATPRLNDPGAALATPVFGTRHTVWISGDERASVYRPERSGLQLRGTADVRFREVAVESDGTARVTATLVTGERLRGAAGEAVLFQAVAGGRGIDLVGHVDRLEGGAPGEWRFRSVPLACEAADRERLRTLEGGVQSGVPLEAIPVLGSEADAHALGVLGLEALLTGSGATLAETLDAFRGLVRAAGEGEGRLEERLRAAFRAGAPGAELLGRERCVGWGAEGAAGAEAEAVPEEVWLRVLAVLARLMPDLDRESCASSGGLGGISASPAVFDAPVRDLAAVLGRLRSLLVIDWRENREVRSMLRDALVRRGVNASTSEDGEGAGIGMGRVGSRAGT